MNKRTLLVAMVILTIVVGLAWYSTRTAEPERLSHVLNGALNSSGNASSRLDSHISLPPPTPRNALAVPRASKLIERKKLPDEVVGAALPEANAGSVDAMRRLGEALQQCAHAQRIDGREAEDRKIDELLNVENALIDSGVRIDAATRTKRIADAVEEMKALRNACARLDVAQVQSWDQWLEKSARAGDIEAQREYIDFALGSYREYGVSLTNLEEAAHRRDLIREFSSDLVAGGDCSALEALRAVTSNPTEAYTYQLAYLQNMKADAVRGGADLGMFADVEKYVARQADQLSAVQLDSARSSAAYILQTYCGG